MEVIIDGVVYVPKEKTELEIMKEKYESGDYYWVAVVRTSKQPFEIIPKDKILSYTSNAKLIHKKHKDILYAYLKNNSVEIKVVYSLDNSSNSVNVLVDFIESYDERLDYKLKPKEDYPKFFSFDNGMVVKFINPKKSICVLDNTTEIIGNIEENDDINIYTIDNGWESIPYNKERGLYHKQPVWCWLNDDKYGRSIRFYNYHKDELISPCDSNYSHGFQNIELITPDQLKIMPFILEMYKKLKD